MKRVFRAMSAPQLFDELALTPRRASSWIDPRWGRRVQVSSTQRLVASFRLLCDQRSVDGARLLCRNGQWRLAAVAQRSPSAAITKVDDVLAVCHLYQVNLVDLIARSLPKPEPRLFDYPHRAAR